MKEHDYSINLNHLTSSEYFSFPDSFEEYKKAVLFLLNVKQRYDFEEDLIEKYKNEFEVERALAEGKPGMEAILSLYPDAFINAGSHPRKAGEPFLRTWFDLWQDYIITPSDTHYDLFLAYHLRHTDLMEMDSILNSLLERYYEDNKTIFGRVLKLTLRKHGQKLLQPEQIDTINEWIAEKEKEAALSGKEDTRPKARIKRSRDDKATVLNQEQTALLIYCLQKAKVILKDELLSNKEAGLAFSILTGYSPDTIRQNLNPSEMANTASDKNIGAVEKVLKEILRFIANGTGAE